MPIGIDDAWRMLIMNGNKLLIITIIMIAGLAVSSAVNVVLYLQGQNADPLSRDLKSFTDECGNAQIVSSSYGFTPPITMYYALKTDLENDGWKAVDLQNMTIHIVLCSGEFCDNRSLDSS